MKKSQKHALELGAGVAALAAGAAAAYFFTGKGGAKNRKKVSAWAGKAKKEVLSEMKKMKVSSKSAYHKAVDNVLADYKNLKHVDKSEFAQIAKELKSHWNSIQSQIIKGKKTKAKSKPATASSKKK